MTDNLLSTREIVDRRMKFELPFANDGLTDPEYTGQQLVVLSQSAAEKYTPSSNDEVCISIIAYGNTHDGVGSTAATLSPQFKDVLRMQFDDRPDDHLDDVYFDAAVEMTPEQADQIASFVIKHRDASRIVIHCWAGASRSRSTAAAIAAVRNFPYKFTIRNTKVYTLVKNALLEYVHIGDRKID